MPNFLGAIFGQRPNVPTWQNISLGNQQTAAINANAASLPGLESLGTNVTNFNTQQLTGILNTVMPGWSQNVARAQKNIGSELSGQIPTDVAEAIQSSTAAKALTGGFGGSGMMGNTLAKNLGLTSLQLMNQGQSSLESWSNLIDSMYSPEQFNVTSMFVNPQQMFEDTFQNQEASFNQQWLQNQVSAMPNPEAAGLYHMLSGALSGVTGGLLNFTGSSGGGGGGGGGGGILSMLL